MGTARTLAATGLPPICRRMTFDVGPFALRGSIPDANEGKGGFCPRRTVLDSLLVKAAAECGVEVRESFTVDELLMAGDTVVGVRGHGKSGTAVEERARLVIGADGVNSFVARGVQAPVYEVRPVAACCYYSYFSGIAQDDIELYVRDHCAFGGAPDQRRPSPRDGELARRRFLQQFAPTSRATSGGRSRSRPAFWPASARAVAKTSGTARRVCPDTSESRMARAGRSSATPATTAIRLPHRASVTHSSTPRCWPGQSARGCRALRRSKS